MPELPEVETVARQLAPLVVGQVIKQVRVVDPKLVDSGLEQLRLRHILRVYRLGKQVLFDLAGGRQQQPSLHLGVHLRMTGRLRYFSPAVTTPAVTTPAVTTPALPDATHLRASFLLSQGKLDFCDVRRFGTMRVDASKEVFAPSGVEPMTGQFTAKRLGELLGQSRQELKVWLLRQDRLVGLGNIYASEILFAAKLSPFLPAGGLSRGEVGRLHRQIKRVLEKAIDCCGTTFSDFQDAQGKSGGFARFLKVYGRQDEPCRRCGHTIARITQQGRATFFCASCQSGS